MESMFDVIAEHAPDGKEVKERNDFQRACDAFVIAEKRFAKINLTVRLRNSPDAGEWFPALKQKYATEERLWELFCAGFETTQMSRLYLEFRDCLLSGKSMRADA